MQLQSVALGDLKINPNNDRHGELTDEAAAIGWLLENKTDHMKHLAQDIVDQGQVYESPLVVPAGGKFLVYDGNRRVTCLKLLENPAKITNPDLQKYFLQLRNKAAPSIWAAVECQVELDRDRVDEILYRRHTGSQSGVGQSG